MKQRSAEVSVGLFVLLGLACVAYLTIRLGKMELLSSDYYHIKAGFTSVAGLKSGAIVDIAGVQVGKVGDISLDREKMLAVVTLKIKNGVRLSPDSFVSVRTRGLIGDKYLSIQPGGEEPYLQEGGVIDLEFTEPSVSIEEMIAKFAFSPPEPEKE